MSNLKFIGKISPRPFISLRKEEELRIKEIKGRLNGLKNPSIDSIKEITYQRDAQEDY